MCTTIMYVLITKLVTNALFHLFHKQHKQIHLKCKILIIFSDKFIGSNEDSFLKLFWLRKGFNKKEFVEISYLSGAK